MKETCVRMKMSDDGRILIPKGLRNGLGIVPGQEFDISYNTERNVLELKKSTNRCVICGNENNLSNIVDEIVLCDKCLDLIKNK